MARDKVSKTIAVPRWRLVLMLAAYVAMAVSLISYISLANSAQERTVELSAEATSLKAEIDDLEDAEASSDITLRQCAASAELYATSASTLSAYIVWLLGEGPNLGPMPDVEYAIEAYKQAEALPCE